MKDQIRQMRTQLEEHLASINENTVEIQGLFDYINELELKLERLTQRFDAIQLQAQTTRKHIAPLTQLERSIFLSLYTEETPLSPEDIALRTGVPSDLIRECTLTLARKGIPLLRTCINNQLFLKLDPQFKELQAKENIINLSLQNFMG